MRSASRKPRVMTSTVGSPLRSSSALVATVVPILTAAIRSTGIGCSAATPSRCRMPATAASRYCSGFSDSSLCVTSAPCGSRATMSVNVPPRSIQNSQVPDCGSALMQLSEGAPLLVCFATRGRLDVPASGRCRRVGGMLTHPYRRSAAPTIHHGETMNRRTLFVRTAAAALALGLGLPAVAQTKWDLPAGYPAGNPHTQNLNQFATDVATASGGKLNITVHAGGSLFKAPEIKRAVQTGQAQAGEVLMSLLENENPVFGADAVPFVATGFDASWKLWQAQRPIVEKILAAQGIKLLYAVAWPPQGIYTKKQLNSVADMKALKWRAYNPATTRIAAMVGAQPLTIQAAELSQALATGVVDSFMSSGATGVDSKVWESLSHFATADAWLPKNMVIINQ